MMKMYIAAHEDKSEILALYKDVIDHVNRSSIRLGWNIDIYPDPGFIYHEVDNRTMLIWREDSRIIAAAAADHTVNPEYDSVDWDIKEPKDKISTIHALALRVVRNSENFRDWGTISEEQKKKFFGDMQKEGRLPEAKN